MQCELTKSGRCERASDQKFHCHNCSEPLSLMVGLEPVDGFQKVSGDGVVGVYLIDNGQTIMEVEKGKLRKGNTADLIVFASEKVQETT